MKNIEQLKRIASQVRRDIIRMVTDVQSGHPGGSLGTADFFTVLYNGILKHDPQNFEINGHNQDMFFLSNGHISPVWYSTLAHCGYFPVKELSTFRKIGSRLQGHPTNAEGLPGIRIASGSLGQGLSVANGAAIVKKMNNDPHLIYTLHGDGELQEGQIWEAMMFAAARKLDNIIATVDWNNQQIDGTVDSVLTLGDLGAKWKAFGWIVLTMNGNDIAGIIKTMAEAKAQTGKGQPVVVLMKTEMGYGVDFMQGTNAWHGKAPSHEQAEQALSQLEETLGDY